MRTWMVILGGLLGCGDDGSSAVPDGATPDAHVTEADVGGTVVAQGGEPIASAEVCLNGVGSPQCTLSGGDGMYTLHLQVPDGDAQVTGITTAIGYLGRENLFYERPSAENHYAILWEQVGPGLYSTADATTLLATQAGFTYPTTTKGFVLVNIIGADTTDRPMGTATISATGAHVVYMDDAGVPDPSLTSGDQILFGDVTPGSYDITVQSPGRTCSIAIAGGNINDEWPPVSGGSVNVDVTANVLTEGVSVICI